MPGAAARSLPSIRQFAVGSGLDRAQAHEARRHALDGGLAHRQPRRPALHVRCPDLPPAELNSGNAADPSAPAGDSLRTMCCPPSRSQASKSQRANRSPLLDRRPPYEHSRHRGNTNAGVPENPAPKPPHRHFHDQGLLRVLLRAHLQPSSDDAALTRASSSRRMAVFGQHNRSQNDRDA